MLRNIIVQTIKLWNLTCVFQRNFAGKPRKIKEIQKKMPLDKKPSLDKKSDKQENKKEEENKSPVSFKLLADIIGKKAFFLEFIIFNLVLSI